jgi:hypothetical protein
MTGGAILLNQVLGKMGAPFFQALSWFSSMDLN